MALTKEDLQAIEQIFDKKMGEKLEPIYTQLDMMQGDMTETNAKLAVMQEDISEIKEHAEITRSASNSLVEWAETVGVITQVEFPVKKVGNK